MAADKLPEAFDYILVLAQKYPGRPELGPLRESFLQKSATAAYRDGQPERTIAILAGLFESNPQFAGLARGVDATGDKCMTTFVGRRDLRSAREFLDRTEEQFPGLTLTFVGKWRERFQAAAQDRLTEAERQITAKDFDSAQRAVEQARDIWPTSPDARRLILRINQLYPVLTVGVLERADPNVPPRLDAPAARRLASATTTPVVELLDYRSEGGEYGSPWGEVSFDIATRQLTLKFNSQVLSPTGRLVTPYTCAQASARGGRSPERPVRSFAGRSAGVRAGGTTGERGVSVPAFAHQAGSPADWAKLAARRPTGDLRTGAPKIGERGGGSHDLEAAEHWTRNGPRAHHRRASLRR